MRKFKGIFVSATLAAVLAASTVTAYAEETTEATETVETAEETTEAAGSPEVTIHADFEVSESDSNALVAYAEQSIAAMVNMPDEELQEILEPSSILSIPQKNLVASAQSWMTAKEELGAFKSVESHAITVDDDMIIIESACEFENSEGTVSTLLDRDTLKMESMNFSGAAQSFGTKMKEAGMNTLVGMGIVFIVLIFLSFLIAQFKHISAMEARMKNKNAAPAPAPAQKPAAPAPAPVVEEEVVDDGELIAVIAAAIAAAEGTSTDGFVVRSIKKSNRNKWQRA